MEDEDTQDQSPDSAPEPSADPRDDEIARLAQESADLKDKYLRALAEMENIRRRAERDKAELSKYALERAFKDFLPVLDTLDKALPDDVTTTEDSASVIEGMRMAKRQLVDSLKKHGLESITSAGTPFDPNVHQAIQRVDSSDVSVETVGNEFARGYLLNGRLLRPAIVSVLIPGG